MFLKHILSHFSFFFNMGLSFLMNSQFLFILLVNGIINFLFCPIFCFLNNFTVFLLFLFSHFSMHFFNFLHMFFSFLSIFLNLFSPFIFLLKNHFGIFFFPLIKTNLSIFRFLFQSLYLSWSWNLSSLNLLCSFILSLFNFLLCLFLNIKYLLISFNHFLFFCFFLVIFKLLNNFVCMGYYI